MTKKYYAVRNGRKVGIFETWEETKAQVIGYKNAIYKSFKTLEEAKAFINNEDINKFDFNNLSEDECIVYVDGSYNISKKIVGYGIVFIDREDTLEINGALEAGLYTEQRNVAGEVYGSMEAINLAIEKKKKKIYIHFDYMGIKAWAEGEWKTNIELTKNYKKFVEENKKDIDIYFIKVKAHSNDKFNDMADSLAKTAVGIK
nr:ribonuclease H family protein [Helcococcus sueciensis]